MWISAARGLAGAAVFSYASYADLRTRRVDNRLWLLAGGLGAILLATEAVVVGFPEPLLLLSIPIVIGIAFLLYQTGLLFGGADAKALMALALLVPFHAALKPALPLFSSLLTDLAFPLAVLGNALLVTILVPVALLVVNLARRDLDWPFSVLGTRVPVDELDRAWVWPMERVGEDGEVVRTTMPTRAPQEVDPQAYRDAGMEEVWVTPKLPFMVPLTAGYALAFTAGDLITALVRGLVPGVGPA